MRLVIGLMSCLLLTAGCGPAIEREDLGTVSHHVPEVPGAEEPYRMPELDEPSDAGPSPVQSPQTPD